MQEYIQLALDKKIRNIYFKNGRWFLHLIILAAMLTGLLVDDTIKGPTSKKLVYAFLTFEGPFYACFYVYCQYLIPQYFKRNRQFHFWLYLLCGLLILPIVTLLVQNLTLQYAPENFISPLSFSGYWDGLKDTLVSFVGLTFVLYMIEAAEGRKTYNAMRRELVVQQAVEQNLIKARMDPQFVIRSLEGIAYLAQQHNTAAPEAVTAFADVLRYRLYNNKEEGKLSEEIDLLKRLCIFQNTITGHNHPCTLNTMGETKNKFLPTLLLVNIAENAIKTYDETAKWSLFIYLLVEEDELDIIIELPSSIIDAAFAFDNIISLTNKVTGEDCIFTKEHNDTTVSLNICIPLKRSAA